MLRIKYLALQDRSDVVGLTTGSDLPVYRAQLAGSFPSAGLNIAIFFTSDGLGQQASHLDHIFFSVAYNQSGDRITERGLLHSKGYTDLAEFVYRT
jgi:hypothetical protein